MSAYNHVIDSDTSQLERAFLVEALELLIRERSNALRMATAVAKDRGDRVPEVRDFGLEDILRLSRQIAEVPSAEPTIRQSHASQQNLTNTSAGTRKPN
ncbi:hypothetical protein QFZ97_004265 [Paraburkholderia youngii]